MNLNESESILPPAAVSPPAISIEGHDENKTDAPIPSGSTQQDVPHLSKNARKRLLKAARNEERRVEWKKRDKELKKEKQRIKAEKKRAAAEDFAEVGPATKKQRLAKGAPFNARIVIDLGFDEKMVEKEVKSLCSQLGFTYASNQKASTPFKSLLFTSLNGRTKQRLEEIGDRAYLRWKATEWWEEGYEKLWEDDGSVTQDGITSPAGVVGLGSTETQTPRDPPPDTPALLPNAKSRVVYLTADSSCEIEELVEGETYIIGGIVDKNRYKNLCQHKAEAQDIRTAKLPIGKYLSQMQTRKVLTVNQVFDILLQWLELRDWEAAFLRVMPKRKFAHKAEGEPPGDGEEDHENHDGGLELADDLEEMEDKAA